MGPTSSPQVFDCRFSIFNPKSSGDLVGNQNSLFAVVHKAEDLTSAARVFFKYSTKCGGNHNRAWFSYASNGYTTMSGFENNGDTLRLEIGHYEVRNLGG